MFRLAHSCFICLTLFALSTQAIASPSSPLNQRLGIHSSNSDLSSSIDAQIADLEQSIAQLRTKQQSFDEIIHQRNNTLAQLELQLKQSKQSLSVINEGNLTQQASMAYIHLSELKETEATLNQTSHALARESINLSQRLAEAQSSLTQHLRTPQPPEDSPTGRKYRLQAQLLEQQITTLQSQLSASPIQIEINQLQQQISRYSLKQQEQLIEKLNQKNVQQRQAYTDSTVASIHNRFYQDDMANKLNQTNQQYAQILIQLNDKINTTITEQQTIEKRYQTQAIQLSNVQEQVTWVRNNAAFGERFLSILHSLPKLPNQAQLLNELADTRIQRYQLEQARLELNNQLVNQGQYTQEQLQLMQSQAAILDSIIDNNYHYLTELGKLRVAYEQLTQQHNTLKNTLSEHLFWVPNAPRIGPSILADIVKSISWIIQADHWQQLLQERQQLDLYWAWLAILVVLCLIAQDMLTPKFDRLNQRYAGLVGNVTQDKIKYTFKTLLVTAVYAMIKPLPIVFAGFILISSKVSFVYSLGYGLIAIGLNYFAFRLIYLLCAENGIVINHFKQSEDTFAKIRSKILNIVMITSPLVGLILFSESLDVPFVHNSIGRVAFILLCIVLFNFYRNMFVFIGNKLAIMPDKQNMRLFQKLIWILIITIPVVCAVLAAVGYYFTAAQLLFQLQIFITLGLSFVLLYNIIKRWMLLEQRVIAFERAKAKRAEQLAQRERGETNTDTPESFEEPEIDLDVIASQSIGLVRSIILLAFFASLIGSLSHTHTAVLSFLDGIDLWTTNSTINGIEQQLPITLKSLLFGLILAGFSMMIAKNLPGLLELTILRKLDLTPGTAFAITTVSSYLVIFIGLMIAFSSLGVEWSKLQWLIAALSVGLGFGLQEIFANFISGLIILFEKPIRIGDTVTIRDLTGTVSKIQIRATTIVDWDRKEIIVPNKAFITEQLINWSLSDPITRVIVKVAVARDSDPTKVEMLLHQAVRECEMSLATPEPEVWFAGFGQHTQDYEVRSYAKDMDDRWPLRHNLHKRITKKLRENQVELAYPQMEIHINSMQSKEANSLIKV
ncbi:mechanosensitive ion channel domain-containing protein [Shewanella maritima]|uniref:mechanosensitive ion channel domain-containing protein n=1 Tax=Shewanella maritima TaxID=2520507 RepID=UPI003736919D